MGSWLVPHLRDLGDEVAEAPADLDVTRGEALKEVMVAWEPDAVYHLAAWSHVGRSWEHPEEALRVNALGTLALLEAARACRGRPRVLLVSSAEVYGRVQPADLPIGEDSPLRPVSPYAASKVAAEFLGVQAHLAHGLAVLRARPFNHVGPGQSPDFVVPAMARRILEASREGRATIKVGNLSARRDFTDVRDVVRAYRLLVLSGEPGQVYNVCSGRDVAIKEVVQRLAALVDANLRLEPDPGLMRPADVAVLRGDPSRLVQATGWRPEVSLEQTLADVLAEWRETLVTR